MKKLLTWLLALIIGSISLIGANFVTAAPTDSNCNIATLKMKLADGVLSYNKVGKGRPILLLHGLFADKEQWNSIACQLSQAGYQAIAPDLPGYGNSKNFPVQDYALENQTKLLHELTTKLGIQKVDLAGSSMGGAIAHLYSQQYPRQIHSIAFIGSPLGVIDWSNSLKAAIIEGINPFIPITDQQFDLEMSLLFVKPPQIPNPIKQAKVEDYLKNNRNYQQTWDIVNLYDRLLEQPPTHTFPTLIFWGEADKIYDISGAKILKHYFPNSQVWKLPQAGHLLLIENADQVTSLYLKFLKNLPSH
jgi:pimeloyl-ACP methyl ester carboxylesterase